jgi:tellurite resistance protein TehA-like permease
VPTQQPESALKNLHPAYFALVMATGIVAISSQLHGFTTIAWGLLCLNVVQYAVLVVLLLCRIAKHADRVIADAGDHLRGPGFFTLVAATGVFSSQWFIIARNASIGVALAVLTILLWLVIIYLVFALLIVKLEKPSIEKGINGGWLVGIVATQAVSIVSVQMSAYLPEIYFPSALVGLFAWSFGIILYLWIISLIFYRYMFFSFQPNDLSPPYWINMGAVAISTLAGCNLMSSVHAHPLLLELLPFIKGVTILLWATATWWIPMLVILGFWRHVVRRFPLRYDPLYWGMVFPLGMYSACTFRLAEITDVQQLYSVAWVFLGAGAFAWTVVFAGMLHHLTTAALRPAAAMQPQMATPGSK